MWLRLGDNEIINMEHVVFIRKGPENTIEFHFRESHHLKVVPFRTDGERDYMFDMFVGHLVKLRAAME